WADAGKTARAATKTATSERVRTDGPPNPAKRTAELFSRAPGVSNWNPMFAALASAFALFAVPQPTIVQKPIPFPAHRKREMAAYAKRHYGIDSYRLKDPHVIVEHYTVTSTFQQTFNTFAPDVADSELHELPGTCSHYVIDKDGTIYQLVPRSI